MVANTLPERKLPTTAYGPSNHTSRIVSSTLGHYTCSVELQGVLFGYITTTDVFHHLSCKLAFLNPFLSDQTENDDKTGMRGTLNNYTLAFAKFGDPFVWVLGICGISERPSHCGDETLGNRVKIRYMYSSAALRR